MFNVVFVCIVFLPSALISNTFFSQGSNILYREGSSSTVRQRFFVKEEFHYLNVSVVGTSSVYDVLDCTFKCICNPLCFSVNLAASTEADGEAWCELLSSDKYRNSTEYTDSRNAHHFFLKSPCSSSPCQNKATCVTNYKYGSFECLCKEGYVGKYCERAIKSCKEMFDLNELNTNQLVTLIVDSKPLSVFCHVENFGCGRGGWTPVMKIDGNKVTFRYDSEYWVDKNTFKLGGGKTGFDSQETKLPTYWNTSFSKICLGMKNGQNKTFIGMNKQAESPYSLIADGNYRNTSLGRTSWKNLIGSDASLQQNCNMEGFNAVSKDRNYAKARIGILGNNEENCDSSDSWIGFGTGVVYNENLTCGNYALANPDNGDKTIGTMGYILVQ